MIAAEKFTRQFKQNPEVALFSSLIKSTCLHNFHVFSVPRILHYISKTHVFSVDTDIHVRMYIYIYFFNCCSVKNMITQNVF